MPSIPNPEMFLDRIVSFPNGSTYERLRPITDYRRDPGEARILFTCRQQSDHGSGSSMTNADDDRELIMKVKIQVPPRPASDDPTIPLSGPSEMTRAELKALRIFRERGIERVPHLVATTCKTQGPNGPFPNGYISYTIMTKMPGENLMDFKFWSQSEQLQDEIRSAFLLTLKEVWRQGIAPYDTALRNVIWEPRKKCCSIVDFEHYNPAQDPINMHENEEMQRWGLVQRPPPSHWAIEWGLIKEYNKRPQS